MCDDTGGLFIKPCTQKEIDFYKAANCEHRAFANIMPTFMGDLRLLDASLDAQIPASANMEVKQQLAHLAQEMQTADAPKDTETWVPNGSRKIPTDKAVVLENASHGFVRPNILDAKLGRQLWSADAPAQKRRRFDAISAATTHHAHGFRIAGMRVWRGGADADDASALDAEGYRIYDKDYGRLHVHDGNLTAALRRFIFNPVAGIDDELGRFVAEAFLRDLRQVQRVLEAEESRMYSSSLLFVFEGDGAALREAIRRTSSMPSSSRSSECGAAEVVADADDDVVPLVAGMPGNSKVAAAARAVRSNSRVDSGIAIDDDGEMMLQMTDDEEEEEEEELAPVYSLKLIDFAHAEFVPGQGPDENTLLGVRSLIRIFEELARPPQHDETKAET